MTVSGYQTLFYKLPELRNSLDRVSPIYIDLPSNVKEFASYDPVNHVIQIDKEKLREEHEGTYKVDVDIGYGSLNREQKHRVTMFIILKDLGLSDDDEKM